MKYRVVKRYKYQLTESFNVDVDILPDVYIHTNFLDLSRHGDLIIKEGYAWDGPSGPTIDTESWMRGSLVHDALYQLLRLKLIDPRHKQYADDLMRRYCLEDGMCQFRAWYSHLAVKWFGGRVLKP